MRSSRAGLQAGVLAAALAVLWLGFAPVQVGGSVIYTSTVGNSMEPRFHKGDLALVRPSSSYGVGEIVLYRSPVLHRPVLHRIIAVSDGRYFFKGDHNDFVDPGSATRGDLLGTLWLRIPKAGKALSFIGKPSHAALLAGLAALAVVVPTGRRRRRVKGHLHRPMHPAEDAIAIVLVVAAALALVVGFTTPVKRPAPETNAYRQSGTLTYSARATRPTPAYPDGYAHTGQPLFLSKVQSVSMDYRYRFASPYDHGVRGTIGLYATISSESSSWQHTYVIIAPHRFSGDRAELRGAFPLAGLEVIADDLARAAGTSTVQHQIVVEVRVNGHGYVDGHPVTLSFHPQVPFTMTNAFVKVDTNPAALPAGAVAGSSPSTDIASVFDQSQTGAVPGTAPNSVRLMRFRIGVLDLRGVGIGLAGLALIVIATRPWRRRRDRWTPEQHLAAKSGCVVVDVLALDERLPRTEVKDFQSLAGFAAYLARPILHDLASGAYAVEDGGRLYVFRAAAAAPAPPTPVAPPKRRKGVRLRWLGAGLALLVAAGIAVSFTAANVVPLTNAGVVQDATSIAELTPPQCAGMSLTHLVVTATGTVTGTAANDLILDGTTAKGTLTGGGGNDCIVSGAPKATLDGGLGTGDVCIATGANPTFRNCEATYTGLG